MESSLDHIPPFRPPAWCRGGHLHTVACSLLGDTRKPPCRTVEISTPDGDFLEAELAGEENSGPCIALFHGLEGSTDRYYMTGLMRALPKEDFTVLGVNFRGCGSRLNRRPRFYHSGETGDYRTVFGWLRDRFPGRPLGAVGFSLGGNALLKYLGEEKAESPLFAAVAVSVPYDLKMGSICLSRGFNRVYEYYFLRSLRRKLEEKRERFPELPRFEGSTLYEFDEQVTAPLHGFRGADDYYYRCSSRRFLEEIETPALLVHSLEDPLCPVESLPRTKILDNPVLDHLFTRQGGHVGFRSRGSGWLNRVITGYLSAGE